MKLSTKLSSITFALALSLPFGAAQAADKADPQAVINSLSGSIASAELSIALNQAETMLSAERTQFVRQQLAGGIARTELTLALVAANEAIQESNTSTVINSLNASLANAELSLAIVSAGGAIQDVQQQDAVNMLSASIASAELNIVLAEASQTINGTGNAIMMAELEDVLAKGTMEESLALPLIAAVTAERPSLAPVVQEMALTHGYNQLLVSGAIINGLSNAEATAAAAGR